MSMHYESSVAIASTAQPGVVYQVARMSFGRRLELVRRIRDLAPKIEFLEASGSERDEVDARLLSADVDRLYLLWGLRGVGGLEIDGQAATPELLVDAGPEVLYREALTAVKETCCLNEEERKN